MTAPIPAPQAPIPQDGHRPAVRKARVVTGTTRPAAAVRDRLRREYAADADAPIASDKLVATHFATLAAADQDRREVA